MEYFLYLSDTKIEMLFDQVAPPSRGKLAGELEFNIGVLKAKFSTASVEKARHEKIQLIEKALAKKIGTIYSPKEYFAGTMDMVWGPYEQYEDIVYFSGAVQGVCVGLGGSINNCVHSDRATPTSTTSFSYSPRLVAALARKKEIYLPGYGLGKRYSDSEVNSDALAGVVEATYRHGLPRQRVKFLAKRVLQNTLNPSSEIVLLGTPIYVSLAE